MAGKKQPNVLVFVPHDLGNHLNCYGHSTVKSPNLDKLASNGVKFTNYFTTAPECTSSRASMLTGLYAHQNGLAGLAGLGWELNDDVTHLAQRFSNQNYETHLFGNQHETHDDPGKLGYQQVHCQDNKFAKNVCSEVIEFIKEKGQREKSWFIHAGFMDVHRPWPERSTFDCDKIDVPPYLPDHPEIRRDLSYFHQNILEMDQDVGRVIDELEKNDLLEDTLIIFTTDHGCPFPHAKATFYDPGLNIPLIMYHKGRLEGGKTYEQLLSNIDFTPTVLDYCGLDVPDNTEGKSFKALLDNQAFKGQDTVFGAMYYDVSYDPLYYARNKKMKYIRSFGVDDIEVESANKDVLAIYKAGKWIRFDDYDVMTGLTWKVMEENYPECQNCAKPPKEELYDLEKDPLEQNNLINDPEYSTQLKSMQDQLLEMMTVTNAPLLNGHIEPPQVQIDASKHYGKLLGIR